MHTSWQSATCPVKLPHPDGVGKPLVFTSSWPTMSAHHVLNTTHVVGRIMSPKDVYILIHRTRVFVKVYDKGELRLQMELRLLIS